MNDRRQIVVVGTSIGGLRALKQLAARLPANFPAAVLVVMHVGGNESVLPQVLLPYSGLPVRHPGNGDAIESGRILVAPPDYHMLVEDARILLWHGPKENLCRPAIDPLFRSAAIAYRSKAIGVVLTGNLDDGTIGLQAIKAYGGVAVVQDPVEAEAPSMPASAIEHVDVDFCLPLDRIVDVLVELVAEPIPAEVDSPVPDWIQMENHFSPAVKPRVDELEKVGTRSPFVCPECGGGLWEIAGAGPGRFRCHTGHAYTTRTLALLRNQLAEEAIWAAIRALHEKEMLFTRVAAMEKENNPARAENLAAAAQASADAGVLRKMLGA